MSHWNWVQWTVAAWFVGSIALRPLVIGSIRTKEMQSLGVIEDHCLAALLAIGGFW